MRPLRRDGPLSELLLRTFARQVLPLAGLHPWLRRAARGALRRGLIEVAHPSALAAAAAFTDLDAAVVRLTAEGRARLGVPATARNTCEPLDAFREAIRFAYGGDRFEVVDDPQARLLAVALGPEESHGSLRWLADLVVPRYASELGTPCRSVRDGRGRLLGFERVEVSRG